VATLQLDIVTPSASVFSGEVSEVVLPAWEGQMGVYPQHDALLALLRAGVCKVHAADGVRTYVVGRGFADIGPANVTLLTDSCELAADVDKAQASTDRAEAEKALAGAAFGTEAHNQAQVALEIAQARLDA
jgi:F-type H+-transporting ATPase subunit epsilon